MLLRKYWKSNQIYNILIMKFVCFKKDNKNAVSLLIYICLLKALVGFHQEMVFIYFISIEDN